MPTATPTHDPLIGTVIADRYRMLRPLGHGGMGRVYAAEHVRMGRICAVKVMTPELRISPDAVARFNREAANASRINHPNVAAIYDFGETEQGLLYLAMELVEGQSLGDVLRTAGALPLARVVDILRQASDALAAAHRLGIVHRDLKPDNIMLGRDHDGREWVKLVDFGIAKTAGPAGGPSQTVTTGGASVGTPDFMSPEQLAGEAIDHRSDIFSLGVVVFAMLSAQLPYPPVNSREALVARLVDPPRSLSEVRPDVAWHAAIQEALGRALAPKAVDRFAGVQEFAAAFAAACEEWAAQAGHTVPIVVPVSALGPGHTRRLPRRRRALWAAASMLTVAAAAAILMMPAAAGPITDTATAAGARDTSVPDDARPDAPAPVRDGPAEGAAGGDAGPVADTPSDTPTSTPEPRTETQASGSVVPPVVPRLVPESRQPSYQAVAPAASPTAVLIMRLGAAAGALSRGDHLAGRVAIVAAAQVMEAAVRDSVALAATSLEESAAVRQELARVATACAASQRSGVTIACARLQRAARAARLGGALLQPPATP